MLHSGEASNWKIECDALTDLDWDMLAQHVTTRFHFAEVHGIPRGGLKFAEALAKRADPKQSSMILIVDDVVTSGNSFETFRKNLLRKRGSDIAMFIFGVAVFARDELTVPHWVHPMFTFWRELG